MVNRSISKSFRRQKHHLLATQSSSLYPAASENISNSDRLSGLVRVFFNASEQ
jgi:hypothetical protein